ncbi:hypothetical protein Kpol_1036p42 [Vanderwaltozyma polyspora DSM 70294]|uniref:Protein RCR2 n=1 Tax=Vanderwaltozyma polyspora (strain ATCC 22028 / DSM 70294 / BCRC 21397 / CBS 2163 / NBRC 10782 / NRRL Y-8283 / UCD 57-17) TaxID=436907 RepID=A7TEJ2_VANPO|nr:uncharacterized protein Kpol_1036p42 [Vanderwaltozyma polyspora DSM 70294]EDO19299.1 hypothetical protein Kpol_1036p42 [Vanderwaltozyma polyspora DSM 70294]
MSPINHSNGCLGVLDKRDTVWYGWGDGSGWEWGRWILFALFGLALIVFLISTLLINRRRSQTGRAPIRGTAWLTPPTYRQSQREYNGNSGRVVEDFVPTYTEKANTEDLGHFNQRGEFIPNEEAEYVAPPVLDSEMNRQPMNGHDQSIPVPPPAVVHDGDSSEFDFDRQFRRDTTFTTASNSITNNNLNHIDSEPSDPSSSGGLAFSVATSSGKLSATEKVHET